MSNFLHKMKDALTGHHGDSGNKGSAHPQDSSQANMMDESRGNYNAGGNLDNPNTKDYGPGNYSDRPGAGDYSSGAYQDTRAPGRMEGTGGGNEYNMNRDPAGMGNDKYGPSGQGMGMGDQRESQMANKMNDAGDTYPAQNMGTDTGAYGSGNNFANKSNDMDSAPYRDVTEDTNANDPSNMGTDRYGSKGSSDMYGSDATKANPYASGAEKYGSNDMNAGTRESQAASRMDNEFENQGTYGDTMGQTRNYGSPGDNDLGGNSQDYNRPSNTDSSMAHQVESRAESEVNQRTGQQVFGGGAAAGGSSSNAPASGKRRSSGSKFLNKLDPRVRNSDNANDLMASQRDN
ncbi:hypothetical protein N7540_006112 [Penicillium herquei]|nr:hypothetical protein N7540_006112 [Penicillium herquei]